jgi:hypothetical protein
MSSFLRLFGAGSALLIVHVIAIAFNLYDKVQWIDSPMHFLGGVSVGLMGVGILFLYGEKNPKSSIPLFIKVIFVLGVVALVGIAWEWYEYLLDHVVFTRELIGLSQPSIADTLLDLFFDLLGGGVVITAHELIKRGK